MGCPGLYGFDIKVKGIMSPVGRRQGCGGMWRWVGTVAWSKENSSVSPLELPAEIWGLGQSCLYSEFMGLPLDTCTWDIFFHFKKVL